MLGWTKAALCSSEETNCAVVFAGESENRDNYSDGLPEQRRDQHVGRINTKRRAINTCFYWFS